MLTNSEMKEGRYVRWHRARQRIAAINALLTEGATVQVSTHYVHTRYNKKHLGWFKANRSGAWVQRGKHWDCIDYCKISYWY